MSEPILTETHTDGYGTYLAKWYCPPPPPGVGFRVIYDVWSVDYDVRAIYKIVVAE